MASDDLNTDDRAITSAYHPSMRVHRKPRPAPKQELRLYERKKEGGKCITIDRNHHPIRLGFVDRAGLRFAPEARYWLKAVLALITPRPVLHLHTQYLQNLR